MALTPIFTTQVTITVKDINNNSTALVFNNVINLNFDYFKGMVNIVDAEQGSFFFGISLVTTTTITITGNTIVVVIS